MTVTALLTARAIGTVASLSALANGTGPDFDIPASTSFVPGTGQGQADVCFMDTRTLAASATENLDLAGALTDAIGRVLNLAKVKAIMIRTAPTNTNDVIIGGAATNGFVGPFGAATHTLAIRPGGEFLLAAPGPGWPVTAGTGDLLKILNGGAGTPVTYDIIIIGTTV
jgi:hypothetical protein